MFWAWVGGLVVAMVLVYLALGLQAGVEAAEAHGQPGHGHGHGGHGGHGHGGHGHGGHH